MSGDIDRAGFFAGFKVTRLQLLGRHDGAVMTRALCSALAGIIVRAPAEEWGNCGNVRDDDARISIEIGVRARTLSFDRHSAMSAAAGSPPPLFIRFIPRVRPLSFLHCRNASSPPPPPYPLPRSLIDARI